MRMIQLATLCLTITACGGAPPSNDQVAEENEASPTQDPACPVQGVWQLQSVTADGKQMDLAGWKQMKIITKSHYAWVGQAPDSVSRSLATATDSLSAYRTRASGGGTYRVADSTYYERLEYFSDPRHVGEEIPVTCRIIGDTWHHAFDWRHMAPEQPRVSRYEEVWRRLQ